jgi:integrase
MASIRKKPNSARWVACFTDAAGKQQQRSTNIADVGTPSDRALARRKALEVAHEYEAAARGDRTEAQIRKTLTNLYNVVNPGRRLEWVAVRPFLTGWIESIKTRKTGGTHVRYSSVITRFLTGLGDRDKVQLGEINTSDVQQFVDAGIKAGRRAGTIRLETKILNAAFAHALRQGLVIINPVPAAEIPDAAGETKRPFTVADVRALVAACKPSLWPPGDRALPRLGDWKTAIMLGAFCGLRLGDACNLKWKSVDLGKKLIALNPEKTRRKKNEVILMPIHPSLEKHFLEIATADDAERFVMPSLAGERVGGRSGLSRQFQRIMEVAGIANEILSEAPVGGRGINALGFHSLRHAYVTGLANAGVAQDLRMALVGHGSAEVNELYTHRGLDTLAAAVARLPGL